jgi:type II secretory pathway pseudopilin PulG
MKLTSFILLAAIVAGAAIPVQAQRGERENSQVAQACKAEIQQLCQGQKGKEAEQCLKNNESKLSSQCKGAISSTPKQ